MSEFTGIKKNLREYWNTQGSIYDFGYESEDECSYWQCELHKILGDTPLKILDIGTGTGFIAMNLSILGHDVTGLDFSEEMVHQAREKMQERKLSWKLVMGDAEKPDFPDNSFDLVICRYLLWTLPHPDKAIAKWVRVVKPSGRIVVIDGKRKRTDDTIANHVNKFFWKVSRWIFRGYSGIQGHNLDLEKDLPYFEGIGADEILGYFSEQSLQDCNVVSLDALPEIISRNLPWYLRFGYRSSGIVQVVWGQKPKMKAGSTNET